MSKFITFYHKDDPAKTKLIQLASEPVPAWATDVQPATEEIVNLNCRPSVIPPDKLLKIRQKAKNDAQRIFDEMLKTTE